MFPPFAMKLDMSSEKILGCFFCIKKCTLILEIYVGLCQSNLEVEVAAIEVVVEVGAIVEECFVVLEVGAVIVLEVGKERIALKYSALHWRTAIPIC
jgi:hypothetical protein